MVLIIESLSVHMIVTVFSLPIAFKKKKIQVFVFPIAHHLPFAAKSESLSLRLKKKAINVVVRTLKEGNLSHGGVEKVTG